MFFAILMFGEPGAEIMYPDPGFPIYRSMIEFTGAKPVPIPIREENGFAFTAEETLALITPQTRLIILNSPANPTGGVAPKAEIDAPRRRPRAAPDVAIMSDEIYGADVYDGVPHVSLLQLPRDPRPADPARRLVEDLRHDRLAAGLLGVAEAAVRARRASSPSTPIPASTRRRSRPASPRSTGPQDAVAQMVAEFDERRKIVVEELNKLPGVSCITPKGAFYAFPNVTGTGWKAKQLASTAARGGRRRHHRRPRLRHPRRRLSPPLLRQLGREHPARDRPHGRVSWRRAKRPIRHPAARSDRRSYHSCA